MKPERIKLNDLPAVRREAARVYREMRADPTTPRKDLIYTLRIIGQLIFDSEIEQRIRALEERQ